MSSASIPKSKFAPLEDSLLIEAVMTYGPSDWNLIATLVPGRNARQCRERWNNYANPRLVHAGWTEADDQLLLQKFTQLGSKWHLISRFFYGRGKNAIRNRFLALQRRMRRESIQARLPANQPDSRPSLVLNENITQATPAPQAEPMPHDPLAFLDASFQHCMITWQADWDGDSASHDFLF
jgi:hypothetical protein